MGPPAHLKPKHKGKAVLAGGISGVVEICMTYPLEYVKTTRQLSKVRKAPRRQRQEPGKGKSGRHSLFGVCALRMRCLAPSPVRCRRSSPPNPCPVGPKVTDDVCFCHLSLRLVRALRAASGHWEGRVCVLVCVAACRLIACRRCFSTSHILVRGVCAGPQQF